MLLLVILFKVGYFNLNVVINTCRLMHSYCVFSRVCLLLVFLFVRGHPPLWCSIVTDFWGQEWDGSLTVCINSSIGPLQDPVMCLDTA